MLQDTILPKIPTLTRGADSAIFLWNKTNFRSYVNTVGKLYGTSDTLKFRGAVLKTAGTKPDRASIGVTSSFNVPVEHSAVGGGNTISVVNATVRLVVEYDRPKLDTTLTANPFSQAVLEERILYTLESMFADRTNNSPFARLMRDES